MNHSYKHLLWLAPVVAALLALAALVTLAAARSPAAPTAEIPIGVAQWGRNAYEHVGRADQDGANFTGYGYLTYISGLNTAQLYSGSNPLNFNETTAHFTYSSTAVLTARNVISSVFVLDTTAVITFYYQTSPAAHFSSPASFASGTPIATATVHYQDVLNVQSPNKGLAIGTGDLTQTSATPFSLGGQTYRFGATNLLERLFNTGEGTRTDAVIPKSFTVLAGNAVVTALPGQAGYIPALNK